MAIRDVLRMGHPTLRVKAQEVTKDEITKESFKQLIQDMFETMEHEQGIGIAAPQIGVSKQVAIIGIPNENPRYEDIDDQEDEQDPFQIVVVINPKITVINEEKRGVWEGCLSVPGLRGYVERPKGVKVEFLDLDGNEKVIETEGFAATVFQHEIDHLEGVLYPDRIADISKLVFNEEFEQFHCDD